MLRIPPTLAAQMCRVSGVAPRPVTELVPLAEEIVGGNDAGSGQRSAEPQGAGDRVGTDLIRPGRPRDDRPGGSGDLNLDVLRSRRAHASVRPYLPAVVCELVSSISDYEDMDRVLDVAMVDRVAYLFFTQSDAMRAPAPEPAASETAEPVAT